MNEFDYDVWQKKIIARGSCKKKNGSKSKKCSLPSDGMTKKEWKERCGSVVTFNMHSPMNWDQFIIMPEDIRHDYICTLHDEYGANMRNLAEMFGTSYDKVRRSVLSLGIAFPNGKFMNKEQRAKWEKFTGIVPVDSPESTVQTVTAEEPVSKEPVKAVPVIAECIPTVNEKRSMSMNQLSMKFTGDISVSEIANSLRLILGNNSTGEVQIICNLSPV